MIETSFAVRGTPKGGGAVLTLKSFDSHDDAINHALGVNLKYWDDVWVEKADRRRLPQRAPFVPPPFPWSVLWVNGHAYLAAADGRKIASLLGTQEMREYVANFLCDVEP